MPTEKEQDTKTAPKPAPTAAKDKKKKELEDELVCLFVCLKWSWCVYVMICVHPGDLVY